MDALATVHAGIIDIIKIRTPSTELRVDVVRVIAYRASCRCGWQAPRRDRYREARQDLREHLHARES